jgi:hypothetical protein
MISTIKETPLKIIRYGFIACVVLGLALVFLGWRLVPSTSLPSVAGVCLVLIGYGLAGLFGFGRLRPENLRLGSIFGLLAGAIFAGEILLEYILLPRDNSSWGLIEFGAVFAMLFSAGLVAAYRSKNLPAPVPQVQVKNGILAALVTAMLSSTIWLMVVLITFYIFKGSARQTLVFTAEGNYADFARSGMHNFNAFIMEDFFGAGFFHLLLSPILAALLGTLGGLVGKGLDRIERRSRI